MAISIAERLIGWVKVLKPGQTKVIPSLKAKPISVYAALRRLKRQGQLLDVEAIRRQQGRTIVCILRRRAVTITELRGAIAKALKVRAMGPGRCAWTTAELTRSIAEDLRTDGKVEQASALTEFDVHQELIRLAEEGYLRSPYFEGTGAFSVILGVSFDELLPTLARAAGENAAWDRILGLAPRRATQATDSTATIRDLRGKLP